MSNCRCCYDLLTADPDDADARECIHCGRISGIGDADIPVYNPDRARLELAPVTSTISQDWEAFKPCRARRFYVLRRAITLKPIAKPERKPNAMTRKFASIKNPDKTGYVFDSETYDYQSTVAHHFRQYDTYGDGLCQHSGAYAIRREQLTDYLASIAQYIITENDWELAERLGSDLRQPHAEVLAFAQSVQYKPAVDDEYIKQRFYSLELRKIAPRKKAEYDKRFERITTSEDGSPESVFRLTSAQHHRDIDRLGYADAVRNWFADQTNTPQHRYVDLPAEFLKWTDDTQAARTLHSAYNAAQCVVKLAGLRDQAECNLHNCRNALAPPAAEPVEDSAAA